MAIDKRIEKNNDGSFSIVFEDKDGSGDLNRVMSQLCEEHKKAKQKKSSTGLETR